MFTKHLCYKSAHDITEMINLLIIITTASAIAQDTLIHDQTDSDLIQPSNQFELTENNAENDPEFKNNLHVCSMFYKNSCFILTLLFFLDYSYPHIRCRKKLLVSA